ncbi:ATP-binding protein [Parapedobacter sp. DT-150]|uniref:ATP-binding protein n=1 Tax=Parapedobacter sp. DT-150 TaxID=3396162 RepID=UPI003F1AF6F5
MVTKDTLSQVIGAQKTNLLAKGVGLKREALDTLPDLSAYALIVSGVRRCGKSTLLYQLLQQRYPNALYLNFEDPRLYGFDLKDFSRLDQIISEIDTDMLLFDEIQIIPDWERYVRQKLDENMKLVITGSNASLLSRELGTKLTGRHITKELFPFSYSEFNAFTGQDASPESAAEYLQAGGFPEYVKQRIDDILNYVLEDILIRDIAVRHGIRDVDSLQRLALYLISNVGKLITANRLKSLIGVGSTNTITEYLSYLEASYLLHFIPKFDYSQRKQLVNPRKVYAIDTGLVNVNSASFTDDSGRLLENMVYLHLRRQYKDIFYFSATGECDFVAFKKGNIQAAIQVCYQLNADNLDRELNGMIEALDFFKRSEGLLITHTQRDYFEKDGKRITVLPVHEYLTGSTN